MRLSQSRHLVPGRPGFAIRAVVVLLAWLIPLGTVPTVSAAASTPQAITFTMPVSGTVGESVPLTGSADSGLAVAYAVTTDGICSISDATLHLDTPGTCSVTASQAGDATYAPATDVSAAIDVQAPSPTPTPTAQLITFGLPASGFVGTTITLTASADSGLPVAFASSTPGTCSVVETSLHLESVGTCTVTASQAGDATHAAAPDVQSSITVATPPEGVDLGRYAVNGTVRAAVTDATTGLTYLGGDFTQVGVRTGPVAVVGPPDSGDGALQARSPEVLGTVRAVLADDRPGDPGFFVVGRLIAVNGSALATGMRMIRLHLDTAADRWVADPGWPATSGVYGCDQVDSASWTDGGAVVIAGGPTSPSNTAGLWAINRATGQCSNALSTNPALLPGLASCSTLPYCMGAAGPMVRDQASGRLYVAYTTLIGKGDVAWRGYLASYDLATGHRLWLTALQSAPAADALNPLSWWGHVAGISVAGSRVLVRGGFPFDVGDQTSRTESSLLAIHPSTGVITQRWNRFGEESLVDGSTLRSADTCLTGQSTSGAFFHAGGLPAQWVYDGGIGSVLCRYSVVDGAVAGTRLDAIAVRTVGVDRLPTDNYTAPDGTGYLVGPWAAFNLDAGSLVDWHPDPATSSGTPMSFAISSAGLVLAGDFPFVRGRRSPGVVAMTSSLSPDPTFTSPIGEVIWPGIQSLALDRGWLLVGGLYSLPASSGSGSSLQSLVALSPSTGRRLDWTPSPQPADVRAIAVNPASGEFWVGVGGQRRDLLGTLSPALLHFASPADGGTSLPAPDVSCLRAPTIAGFPVAALCAPGGNGTAVVTALSFDSDGRLYVGGTFGAVDGVTHRGLARIDPSGAVDPWNADLVGALPIPSGSGLWILEPYALAASGDRLLVGGQFCRIAPNPSGGGSGTCVSPLLVYSVSSGELLRPTDPDTTPWFPISGWWTSSYAIVSRDNAIVLALGDEGVMILNPVTLDFDAAASAPLTNTDWWARDPRNGVFALAVAAAPVVPSAAGTGPRVTAAAVASPTRILLAGSIARWRYRVAGNVVATSVAATPKVAWASASPRTAASLSSTSVRVHLSWTASDPGGPGIARYELARSLSGGSWVTLSTTVTSPSADVVVRSSGTVRFRVRAVDLAGTASAWATGPVLTPRLVQQFSSTVRYAGTWTNVTASRYSGGSERWARATGATATFTATGRSVALVVTTGANRGKVKVYVNGVYVGTVDTRSSATRYRVVVWQKTWRRSATRTIRLVVAGTPGRPRVDLDAFVTIK